MFEMVLFILGAAAGAVAAWYVATARARGESAGAAAEAEGRARAAESTVAVLQSQADKAKEEAEALRSRLQAEGEARVKAQTELADATRNLEDQRKLLEEARTRLADTFKALSSDALKSNNQAFLDLARKSLEALVTDAKGDLGKRQEAIDALLKPLRESLKQYDTHVQAIEQSRQKAYGGLEEQLKSLTDTQRRLERETRNLGTALRNPQVRGRWGEISLHRVVELAGMSEHCDFTEQVSVQAEGGRLRPDMLVHLPAGRQIVVDAKVSLDAYLRAVEAETDEDRRTHLADHARQTRDHMKHLSEKAYWDQFDDAPEFVVMFIPGEPFFGAAADHDPALIEDGMRNRVVLATPTTLIALLRAVAYGWRQEQLAQNAQVISDLGRQLYDRLRTLSEHMAGVGNALERANQAYNRAVGSMEARIFPAARRFRDLGVSAGADIPVVEPVETTPRKLNPASLDDPEDETPADAD